MIIDNNTKPLSEKKAKISPALILKIAIIGLFLLQVYSYFKADWVSSTQIWTSTTLLYKHAYSNKAMELIRYLILAVIVFVSAFMVKHDKISMIYMYLIVAFTVVYSVEGIMEVGLSKAMYSGNMPAIYMLVLAFFLGRVKTIWDEFKKTIPLFVIAYILLLAFEFVDSYSAYGWVIYQNSSMMAYYAHLFAFSLIYLYTNIVEGKKSIFVYLVLLALVVGAFLVRSRGWVIESVIVVSVVSLTMYRRKNKSATALIKGIIVLAVITVVFATVLTVFFGEFVNSLVEKGTTDSRSLQYIELLEQTEPYKWLFGQGMNATYTHKNEVGYAFIDNEIFYMSFHYGIFFTTLYFAPYVLAILKCIKTGKKLKFWLFSAIIIFLWVASVNGLSVFNRIHLDAKSFIVPFLAGHIYQTAIDSAEKRSE